MVLLCFALFVWGFVYRVIPPPFFIKEKLLMKLCSQQARLRETQYDSCDCYQRTQEYIFFTALPLVQNREFLKQIISWRRCLTYKGVEEFYHIYEKCLVSKFPPHSLFLIFFVFLSGCRNLVYFPQLLYRWLSRTDSRDKSWAHASGHLL